MNKNLLDIDPEENVEPNDLEDKETEIDDSLLESDSNVELVLEIEDDELVDDIFEEEDFIVAEDKNSEDSIEDIIEDEDITLSKHKIQGKHSLKYDSIFKGKKEAPLTEEEEFEASSTYFNENFEVDKGSIYWFESIDNENYIKEKRIKEKVYEILLNYTDLNFLNNRRKPSKSDFNNYYYLLKTHLRDENFTNVEIFNELAVYFSDNLFNMFKLLDNKWRNLIIVELQEHIGKYNTNPEVSYKNINIGTEIEFNWLDENSQIMIITGVVQEIDEDIFIIDSYEKIYYLELKQITKILNNTKFKYNLNKLNNIDFL
jgi:hypothetical protein